MLCFIFLKCKLKFLFFFPPKASLWRYSPMEQNQCRMALLIHKTRLFALDFTASSLFLLTLSGTNWAFISQSLRVKWPSDSKPMHSLELHRTNKIQYHVISCDPTQSDPMCFISRIHSFSVEFQCFIYFIVVFLSKSYHFFLNTSI